MKKFYKDPVAAAYMAIHFDVDYIVYDEDTGEEMLRDDTDAMLENYINQADIGVVHYIHPDSLHIFEPKLHDLVEWDGLMFALVIGLNEGEVGVQHGESDVYTLDKDECTIIQRDEKPFFTPEK